MGSCRNVKVRRPANNAARHFGNLVTPLLQLAHDNQQRSHVLAALRDTLLPKLLSGEIRVSEADKLAEEVT